MAKLLPKDGMRMESLLDFVKCSSKAPVSFSSSYASPSKKIKSGCDRKSSMSSAISSFCGSDTGRQFSCGDDACSGSISTSGLVVC